VFAFLALIKLDLESVLLCGVCLGLVWSNIYGFWNCSAHARNQLKSAVASGIQQGTMAALTGGWLGGLMGQAGGASSSDPIAVAEPATKAELV
jgi:hypothetical protein